MDKKDRFNAAAAVLRNDISSESAKMMRFAFEQTHSSKTHFQQAGFGIAIRNHLARNGILWEDATLFDTWLELLKEVVRTTPNNDGS